MLVARLRTINNCGTSSWAFQMASNDHPSDNYHHSASFAQQTACGPVCVHVTVAVARYRPTSVHHNIARSTNHAIDITLLI